MREQAALFGGRRCAVRAGERTALSWHCVRRAPRIVRAILEGLLRHVQPTGAGRGEEMIGCKARRACKRKTHTGEKSDWNFPHADSSAFVVAWVWSDGAAVARPASSL